MKSTNKPRWIATRAELAGRYDDIWFLNEDVGWAVNGNGRILKTENGGADWDPQFHNPDVYFRCLSMANDRIGWAGCTTQGRQLFRTTDGRNWSLVRNLPAEAPPLVCGVWALDEDHVFASGTNDPALRTGFMKTDNGGRTWMAQSMEHVATLLVDIYFQDERRGWVVGGRATRPHSRRNDVLPVVLKTEDGGQTWQDNLVGVNGPLGEWGWKIQFVDDDFAVVACENLKAGAIMISEDGGQTWRRQEIRDANGLMVNQNLEGIGFLDRNTGWVGGWGDPTFDSGRTAGTTDGGRTWTDITADWPRPLRPIPCEELTPRGQYINRFRIVGSTVYASGNTVYKFTTQELFEPTGDEASGTRLLASAQDIRYTDSADFEVIVPDHTQSLRVEFFERFSGHVHTLVDEAHPTAGKRTVSWNLCGDDGQRLQPRQFMVRVTCDSVSESRLLFPERDYVDDPTANFKPHLLERV
jgi:photosystem II stability/assembly factor-like uncharacterized protein